MTAMRWRRWHPRRAGRRLAAWYRPIRGRAGLVPRSMRAQTTLIILAAFLLSHAAALLLYSRDRNQTLEVAETLDVAERAASVSILLRNLPAAWRGDVARASDSRTFRAWISEAPPIGSQTGSEAEAELLAYLRTLLPRLDDREVRVQIAPRMPEQVVPPEWEPGASLPAATGDRRPPGTEIGSVVLISVNHPDGQWLNFIGFIASPSPLPSTVLRANLLMAIFLIAVIAFWLVRRVTAPLSRLASAAERLGKNIRTEPLREDGPAEVAQAARAFNRMQSRLGRLVENRTELLASISHDLRTPITQMRLRTELMAPGARRAKNLEALEDMEATIMTFLDFASAANDREERRKIDFGALAESICADRSDVGADIEFRGEDHLLLECKRLAMKRALSNLIDNALEYGTSVRVEGRRRKDGIHVTIDDNGPGIPETEIAAVFTPFYRGDRSRNRRAGGVGLGLSIAQAIVQDHGGEVHLANRAVGGLRAEVILPT